MPRSIGRRMEGLGEIHLRLRDFVEPYHYFSPAMILLGRESPENASDIAALLDNQGMLYHHLRRRNKVIATWSLAVAVLEPAKLAQSDTHT